MDRDKLGTYFLLTGGINNAGDYLISYRAKQLLTALRPDRKLIEHPANEPIDDNILETINACSAIILLGGPGLQYGMYPGVYPLTEDLEKITVPIIMMGLGWKSASGTWWDTNQYRLSHQTIDLLRKISESEILSSVRDYHTLNVLFRLGISNVSMTGCPAYYDLNHINQNKVSDKKVKSISFSIGRMFVRSPAVEKGMIAALMAVKRVCQEKELTVVFHHSTNPDELIRLYPDGEIYAKKQLELIQWLEREGFRWKDISGGAQKLIEHYSDCDFHIGYRLHAHIFTSSVSKPSILIAEDGRGTGAHEVLGGYMFMAFTRYRWTFYHKLYNRLGLQADPYELNTFIGNEISKWFRYEVDNQYIRTKAVRSSIDCHYNRMQHFIKSLP